MLNPCGHRVIVQRDPTEDTYGDSGIIVTVSKDAEKLEAANMQIGVIVAVGPDAWKAFRIMDDQGKEHNGKKWANVGDYVLYSRYSGRNINDPFTPEEEDLMIMLDEDILAIITPESTKIPESTIREKAKGVA